MSRIMTPARSIVKELSKNAKAAPIDEAAFYLSYKVQSLGAYACVPNVFVEFPLSLLSLPNHNIFSLVHTLALCTA